MFFLSSSLSIASRVAKQTVGYERQTPAETVDDAYELEFCFYYLLRVEKRIRTQDSTKVGSLSEQNHTGS